MKRLSLFATTLLLFLGIPLSAFAGQQVVQQELFAGVGVLNSGAPGQLGSVSGSFFKRPVGPRTSSAAAPGWSAQIRGTDTSHEIDLQSGNAAAARELGFFGAWYFFGAVSTDGVNRVQLISLQNLAGGGNNPVATATINEALQVSLSFYNAPAQSSVALFTPNSWVWIGLKWRQDSTNGFNYDATWLFKKPGQPLKILGTPITGIPMNAALQKITAGAIRTGGSASALARYGAPTLFHLDAYGDAAYPANLLEPPTGRQRWYVNPATGDDAQTGLTPQTAWRSASKISEESQYLGLIPHRGGILKGDLLTIDTRQAPLVLGSESLVLATDGLTVRPPAGQRVIEIQAEKAIDPGAWSATSGASHVYQTADTEQDIVLWESDRWMNHPTGANFAAVKAALVAAPGSFWTDGTTLYVHPFEDGNPASNGEIYTRSRFRGAGDSAVLTAGNSWSITGLHVRKTCLARQTDNDPYIAYCFQQAGGSNGGTCVLKNSSFDYGSKHLVGFTADSTNSTLIADHVRGEQASPYVALGGQTAFVSYMSSGSGNVHVYQFCVAERNAGRIGFTDGEANSSYPAFTTHGPENAYALLKILSCRWSGGGFDDQGTVASGGLRIKDSQLGEGLFTSPMVSVRNSRLQTGCEMVNGGTLQSCRLASTANYFTRYADGLAGKVTIEDCVYDLRANPTGTGARYAPWQRVGPLTLIFRRNVFRVPVASDLTLIRDLSASDTLSFSNNIYDLGADGWLMGNYDGQDRTFAQWRALGFDRNSIRRQ